MGFFDRLKNALGGSSQPPQDDGIYLYVKLDRTGEIVKLRLTPQHELVPNYDQGGYFTRKSIVGPRKFERAEATFTFDESRQLVNADISGGALVDEAAWQAQQEALNAPVPPADEAAPEAE